jgi:hypothetical protein
VKFVDDFESFLRVEVNLNQSRLDNLQDRVNAIESFISANDTFAEIFLDIIPAGSWAHRLIIKPVQDSDEFDADVLLYVEEQADWLPKDYIGNLYTAFRDSATYRSLVARKTRCVRINYAGQFHIDVVPYMERGNGHYITNRLDPEDVGRFEASNPEKFTQWIDDRQRFANGTFIKVVRLVKYLRDYKNTFSCKSIILTTLLGNEVNEIESSLEPDKYRDVPSTLVTLLGKLAASLPPTMPAVMDPADTGDNFTDRYKDEWDYENFRNWIIFYADKVEHAYKEIDRDKSTALWREVFGDGFKPGSLAKAASLAPLSASVPWAGEQFIDQEPFGYPINLDSRYRVKLTGRCTGLRTGQFYRRNGFRQFDLAPNGNRVQKNRSLRFTATTNLPPGQFELYWKVRNGGGEASQVKQLRGEISRDQGKNGKTEFTLYKGTHYVECYVVSEGAVVARDRQTVIVA